MSDQELMSPKEAAEYLHCSISHISRLVNGKVKGLTVLPHTRLGGKRIIRREAVHNWLKENETTKPPA